MKWLLEGGVLESDNLASEVVGEDVEALEENGSLWWVGVLIVLGLGLLFYLFSRKTKGKGKKFSFCTFWKR